MFFQVMILYIVTPISLKNKAVSLILQKPPCRNACGYSGQLHPYKPQLHMWQANVNVKTVLFQIIQFSISTEFRCQNSSILNNSVQHKYAV